MFVDFATCEVQSFDAAEKVVYIFAAFQKRSHDDALNPDFEYAIQNGEVKIGIFYPFALRTELLTSSESEPDDRIPLMLEYPGVSIPCVCRGSPVKSSTILFMLWFGAEIYVTVGNDEKVKYLMNNFDIPRKRILFSRDGSFVEDLMTETGGKGVEYCTELSFRRALACYMDLCSRVS
ncbi:hypothetical protein DSL72_008950 [Monilinia vaccinii-corymbosi]|uniref:Uncharacterized protein n=1 Tax=Monilinia vaccinii-corymbosi TaxID=61207 RepID=A0A8A3PRR4_9HELO|nr:hypothetical protein DSL72_008950 [Monilinia vaccinii-corymbosi]